MAAIDFPNSPINGDTFTVGDKTWVHSGGKWTLAGLPLSIPVSITSVATNEFLKWNGTAWVNASGPVGPTGPTGVTGAGVTGVTGVTGATGVNGVTGATGPSGSNGTNGVTGVTGATGPSGSNGYVGSDGVTGVTGATGPTGVNGVTGVTGVVGPTGVTGVTGANGNFGGITLDYTFSTNIASTDPGAGFLKFNNADLSLATTLLIDDLADGSVDVQAFLLTIDDSTSTIKGHFRVSNKLDSTDFALFTISSTTEETGYFTVACSFVSGSSTSFSNNEDVIITFARTGDVGAVGATGATGVDGVTGVTGVTGVGVTGVTGVTGVSGPTGPTGVSGATGPTGVSRATNSTTAPVSPSAGDLWFKTDTAQTFVYYDSFWIEIGGTSGGARMYVNPTAPTSPIEGQLWFKSDTAQTFAYYDSFWIEVGAAGMAAIAGDTAPASPVSGQLWFNSATGGTYVYYDSYWIEVGQAAANTIFNIVNAKGDLLVGTADNLLERQAVGTNGQLLQANSAMTTGLEWVTPAYAPLASPTFTGTVTIPSGASISGFAPLASPTFTGTVVLPATSAGGAINPSATNTYDLGTSALRWRNIYTQDLHLSNGIGDYTVIEGEESLYLVNHKTNKSFKFALIEVDSSEVPKASDI